MANRRKSRKVVRERERERRALTDRGQDGGGKIKWSGKLPLNSGFVRHTFDDDRGQNAKIVIRNVVFAHQNSFNLLERCFLCNFVFTFEPIENSRSDQQVRESADDQRESANVLTLHDDRFMRRPDQRTRRDRPQWPTSAPTGSSKRSWCGSALSSGSAEIFDSGGQVLLCRWCKKQQQSDRLFCNLSNTET